MFKKKFCRCKIYTKNNYPTSTDTAYNSNDGAVWINEKDKAIEDQDEKRLYLLICLVDGLKI